MNGRGTFKWPDKRVYEGEYVNDKKHGKGVFTWPDGRKYKGNWVNGKQHGKGEFYNPELKTWRLGEWGYGKRLYWDDEKEEYIKNKSINMNMKDTDYEDVVI